MTDEHKKETSNALANAIQNVIGEDKSVSVNVGRKKDHSTPDFVMLFQKVIQYTIKELSPSSSKLILLFISKLEWSNQIGMNIETIKEEANMSINSVEKALKELKAKDIIVSMKDPQDCRRNVYLVNPIAIWKGDLFKRKKAIKEMPKNQLDLFKDAAPLLNSANNKLLVE